MSELSVMRFSRNVLMYGAVVLAMVFELAVLWLALHPDVPPDYRAYYLDQSTTCLNQPVSGDYALGTTVSFRSDGRERAMPLRVCGWEGPAGDGTHAVGRRSRLRFALPQEQVGILHLRLDLVAVTHDGNPAQRVEISANGQQITTAQAMAGVPMTIDMQVPPEIIYSNPGSLEVALDFPDAIRMAPGDSDTRMRSIKLLSARLDVAR